MRTPAIWVPLERSRERERWVRSRTRGRSGCQTRHNGRLSLLAVAEAHAIAAEAVAEEGEEAGGEEGRATVGRLVQPAAQLLGPRLRQHKEAVVQLGVAEEDAARGSRPSSKSADHLAATRVASADGARHAHQRAVHKGRIHRHRRRRARLRAQRTESARDLRPVDKFAPAR